MLPYLVDALQDTGLPVTLTNVALQGHDFTGVASLPMQVIQLTPQRCPLQAEGSVDRKGTPKGKPFHQQQRLSKGLRRRNPAAGHSDRRQRYGPENIGTGNIIRLTNQNGAAATGRGVIKPAAGGTGPAFVSRIGEIKGFAVFLESSSIPFWAFST